LKKTSTPRNNDPNPQAKKSTLNIIVSRVYDCSRIASQTPPPSPKTPGPGQTATRTNIPNMMKRIPITMATILYFKTD
jgi:hypothetical protein